VTEGKVRRGADMRVLRNGEVVFKGKVDSLRHLKEDVREMAAGFECGIGSEEFQEFEVGDIIEVYTQKQIARAV